MLLENKKIVLNEEDFKNAEHWQSLLKYLCVPIYASEITVNGNVEV